MNETNPTEERILGLGKKSREQGIYVTHLTVRQSITILVLKIVLIDVISAAIFLVFHSILFNTDITSNLNMSQTFYNTVVFLFLVFCKISLTLYLVLKWLNEFYEVKPNEIIHKSGIIFRKVKRHDLALIRSAKIKRGLVARLLNYGSIELYDIRLERDIELYLIHNPIKYLHILEQVIPDLEEEKQFFAREKVLENPEKD